LNAVTRLAEELGRSKGSLIALAPHNDPFNVDTPAKRLQAEWFAAIYAEFAGVAGVHLRRVHYRILSQNEPVNDYDGLPYTNTLECWQKLCQAAKYARYLKLVDIASFDDRQNPGPIIYLPVDVAE
jgi:hypothetical protein